MFGYNPTLREYIGIPFAFGLAAYAIAVNFPSPEAFVFLWAVEINVAIVPSIFLIRQYIKQEENIDAPEPAPKKYIDLNQPVYNQQVVTLKINAGMTFNKTLVTQKVGGLDVDMTESFWLVKKTDGESEWMKAGGVGRADFVDYIERGVRWGAYKRIGGKNKPVPNQWRKIQQLAQGYPLPQWEQLPKQ